METSSGARKTKMNTSLKSIRLGNWRIGLRIHTSEHKFSGQFMFAHVADTFGITNRFRNTSLQALFLDVDKQSLRDIEGFMYYLDKDNYEIGDSFVFESSPDKYHVICPTLFDPRELAKILVDCKGFADDRFITHYFMYGDNTIRIWPKYTEKTIERKVKFVKYIDGSVMRIAHKGLLNAVLNNIDNDTIMHNTNMMKEKPFIDNSSLDDLICKRYETVNW